MDNYIRKKNFLIIILLSILFYSCSETSVSPVTSPVSKISNTLKNIDFENTSDLFLDINSIAEISIDKNWSLGDKSENLIAKIPINIEQSGLYETKNTSSKLQIKIVDENNNELLNLLLNNDKKYFLNIYSIENENFYSDNKIYINWIKGFGNTIKTLEVSLNNCENCTFVNTSFDQTYTNINYNGSSFFNCYFGNAIMQNCSFQNTLFRNNNIVTSQFQTSDFTNADFYDNSVYDCVFFDTCIFISATVTGGSFGDCGFIDNLMQGMSFKPTSVYSSNFGGCNLQSANLVNYSGTMQDSAVSFIGCDLSYSQVVKYNLSHSNLSGSNFTFTNFMFSNLSYANINASTFYNTDLNNANMCNVKGSPLVFKYVSQIGTQCPYKN